MPDSIDFGDARFATRYMMPKADEEITALWGRKIAWNTARGIGAWGTLVLTFNASIGDDEFEKGELITLAGNLATSLVSYSSLGFNTIPSVDAFIYDSDYGTLYPPFREIKFLTSDNGTLSASFEYKIFHSTKQIWFGACMQSVLHDGFKVAQPGTVIYRLRGW